MIKSVDLLRDASEYRAGRSEVANIYPAFLIGSRAVVLMGSADRVPLYKSDIRNRATLASFGCTSLVGKVLGQHV